MDHDTPPLGAKVVLSQDGLQALITALAMRGYQVLGPVLRDGAIVYDALTGVADLPAGWTDRQDAGQYRLERRTDQALFGYAVGPHAWKRFLHPPIERLWQARREGDGFVVSPPEEAAPKLAFIGVRSCEMQAIAIQDRVFIDGPYPDTAYRNRRHDNFIVAVNCGEAGGTCFCVSMDTGPKVKAGFDLALTELLDGDAHRFLVEVGSAAGAAVLAELPHRLAAAEDLAAADAVIARTAGRMGRHLDTAGLQELLQDNPTHKQWDDVAVRCLTCANCTMVCPTCFCTTVEDHSDLTGQTAERVRRWDSCFALDFSFIHGGSVRTESKSRYRHWMTHKLASWIDQFGTSGCVGCGRCITWCPVGIDITAEVAAIRANLGRTRETEHGGT
ncbi:MAG: 4Fe-4S dicluster domain-containing protein [Acetobacteraceae bacterium]|nr:4Fe-4S dicluster domain-containing protein [Acetobacteraceae bacterium]